MQLQDTMLPELSATISPRVSSGFRVAAAVCATAAGGLGLLGILGWIVGLEPLTAPRIGYILMPPSGAFAFLILGLPLAAWMRWNNKILAGLVVAATIVVLAIGLFGTAGSLMGMGDVIEKGMLRLGFKPKTIPVKGLSVLSGSLLSLSSLGTLLLAYQKATGMSAKNVAAAMGGTVTLAAFCVAVSHLSGSPLFVEGNRLPMSFSSSLALLLMGGGIVLASGPENLLVKSFVGSSLKCKLMRLFIPLAVLVVLATDIAYEVCANHIQKNHAALLAISAIGFAILTASIVAHVSRKIGSTLEQAFRDRQSAKEETTRSRMFFEISLENMLDCFMSCTAIRNQNGRIEDFHVDYVNDATCRLMHKTKSELTNSRFLSVMPGRGLFSACVGTAETGMPYIRSSLPYQSNEPQYAGKLFDVHVGKLGDGVTIAWHDVTDRERAQAGLRQSEERFQAIANYTYDWENWIGPDGKLLWVNPAVQRITGYTPEECLAMRDFPLPIVVEEDRPKVWSVLQESLDTRNTGELEFRIHRKDGPMAWMSIVWLPIKDANGICLGQRSSVRDITEHKRLEEQLLQAQKMEAIGRLAGGVAHDFRNQLTVIKGFSEMLLRRKFVQDEGLTYFDEILKACERSTIMTDQLLAFSRKQMLQPQLVDLSRLLADIAKAISQIIGEDIRLATSAGNEVNLVEIDPGQFQHAIINLATNARDAMPDGGELRITIQRTEWEGGPTRDPSAGQKGKYVVISVSDTGAGMDQNTLDRIFEPFFTTKPVGQGTGLGLAMVYGFVKQSGGFIDVNSELGKGTTFHLYLPISTSHVDEATQEITNDEFPKGSETILVVEDEQAVRRMICSVLQECGYTVLQADGAESALKLTDDPQCRIDMLVTDIVMPGIHGAELARRIVTIRPKLPVLFISGYAGDELSRRGVDEARMSLLTKPFDHVELAQAVRKMLDGIRKA